MEVKFIQLNGQDGSSAFFVNPAHIVTIVSKGVGNGAHVHMIAGPNLMVRQSHDQIIAQIKAVN